jgi:hypothetical protein
MALQAVQTISQKIQVESNNLLFNPINMNSGTIKKISIQLLEEVDTMSLNPSKTKTAFLINQKVRSVKYKIFKNQVNPKCKSKKAVSIRIHCRLYNCLWRIESKNTLHCYLINTTPPKNSFLMVIN